VKHLGAYQTGARMQGGGATLVGTGVVLVGLAGYSALSTGETASTLVYGGGGVSLLGVGVGEILIGTAKRKHERVLLVDAINAAD